MIAGHGVYFAGLWVGWISAAHPPYIGPVSREYPDIGYPLDTNLDGLFGSERPDLIYGESPLSVYEIKPTGSDAAGYAQLQEYLNTSGANAVAGSSLLIFKGNPSLTLEANGFVGRTTYTYTPGVVTYTVDRDYQGPEAMEYIGAAGERIVW